MKKPKPNPTVVLRVEVTPELRAVYLYLYGYRTIQEIRSGLRKDVELVVRQAIHDHARRVATGPDTRVDDLELSVRAANLLQSLGIRTAGDLAEHRFLPSSYATKKVLAEYRASLAPLGLKLRGDE